MGMKETKRTKINEKIDTAIKILTYLRKLDSNSLVKNCL
jgi:hypothetical protein